jgi:hypothetical protein
LFVVFARRRERGGAGRHLRGAIAAGAGRKCADGNRSSPAHVHAAVNVEAPMNGLIYLVGLIVVVMAILSFFGLR